jgi:hypothetical protein
MSAIDLRACRKHRNQKPCSGLQERRRRP